MKTVEKIVAAINRVFMSIAMVLLAFSAVLTVVNAIMRKLPGVGGFAWSEELSTYSVILMLFFGLAFLEQHNQHLCIDVLLSKVKNKTAVRVIHLVRGLVTLVVMGTLVYHGIPLIRSQIRSNITTYLLHMPRAIFFGAMLGGFVLVVLVWIVIILRKGDFFDVD
ncbi:MAG: TRAP transporter small permease [Lachnospiraceae bacterium]|nr:TRAP transporter small permease [Lachnospiraceae bacterium]